MGVGNKNYDIIYDDINRDIKWALYILNKKLQTMIRNDYDYLFKYILIGDTNVGKSCMLMRLLQNRFRSQHEPTLGVEFGSKLFTVKEKVIKLQVWDTAGQQSFKSITRAYYKGSIAAILVFDISSQKSFTSLNNWLYEIKNHSHQKINIMLVGNKKDLSSQRQVSQQTAANFAKQNGFLGYVQISALSGENVEKPFMDLTKQVLSKIQTGAINLQLDSANGVKTGSKIKPKFSTPNIQLLKQPQKKEDNNNKCNC